MRLKNQIVWITGSARRVGRSIALACARAGADVVVHCRRSREAAESVVGQIIDETGQRAWLVQGDHSKRIDVERMVLEIQDQAGGLTGLVNSAAIFPRIKFEETTDGDFQEVIASNLFGPFICSQLALPMLRENSPGRIVNITDWAVGRTYRNYSAYMAAKGGLATLTQALARELAPDVLVNAVAPGAVLEPPDLSDDLRRKIVAKIPLGKWGAPEDIAEAVVYLLGATYVTGQTLTIDGGRTIGG